MFLLYFQHRFQSFYYLLYFQEQHVNKKHQRASFISLTQRVVRATRSEFQEQSIREATPMHLQTHQCHSVIQLKHTLTRVNVHLDIRRALTPKDAAPERPRGRSHAIDARTMILGPRHRRQAAIFVGHHSRAIRAGLRWDPPK